MTKRGSYRSTYREAIRWIAENDDTEWVGYGAPGDARGTPSVTACLVADIFDTNTEQVRSDIACALKREARNDETL